MPSVRKKLLCYVTRIHTPVIASISQNILSNMAESVGNSSSEYSEISDGYVSSSELSKSSESSSEEEIGGKGKAPAKKKKTVKGDEVNSRTTTRTKKKKSQDKSLNASEIEQLTSWIYSTEEAIQVEDHLRSTLLSTPRKSNIFSCW